MLHYRHGRPQPPPIPIEITAEELESILSVAEEPDEMGYAAYELRLYCTELRSPECGYFDRAELEHMAEELRAGCAVSVSDRSSPSASRKWTSATVYDISVVSDPECEDIFYLSVRVYVPLSESGTAPGTRDASWVIHCASMDKLVCLQDEVVTKEYPLELIDTTVEHVDALMRRREPTLEDLAIARVVVAESAEGYGLHDLAGIANSIRDRRLKVRRAGSTKYFRMPVLATELEKTDNGYRLVALLYHEGMSWDRADLPNAELRAERKRIANAKKTAEARRREHLSQDFRKGDNKPFVLEPPPPPQYRAPRRMLNKDEKAQERREREVFRRMDYVGTPECEYVEATPELIEKLNAAAGTPEPMTADDVYILRAVVGDTRNVALTDPRKYTLNRDPNGPRYIQIVEKALQSRAATFAQCKGNTMTKTSYGSPYIRVPGGDRRFATATVFDAAYEPMPDYDGEYRLVAWFYVIRTPRGNEQHSRDVADCARLEAEYFAARAASAEQE